jgi:hypothetical protein
LNPGAGSATAIVPNVEPGATVWMTVHLDYNGKGAADSSMAPRSFTFSATWTVGPLTGGSTTTIVGRPKKTTMVYGSVTTTAGGPIAGIDVELRNGGLKATYRTGADGFFVFYDGMSCSSDFPLGSAGCASGPTGTLSVPAGSYAVHSLESATYHASSAGGSVVATQALRIVLRPAAKS